MFLSSLPRRDSKDRDSLVDREVIFLEYAPTLS